MTASMALMAAASEHALLLCCVGGSAARAEWVRGGGIAPASADWPPPASSSMGQVAPTTASGGSNGEPAREAGARASKTWPRGRWSIVCRKPRSRHAVEAATSRAARREQTRYGQQGGTRTAFQATAREGECFKI